MRIPTPVLALNVLLAAGVAGSVAPAAAAATPPAPAAAIVPADALEASMLKPPVNGEALAEHALFLERKADSEDNPAAATALRRRAYAFGEAATRASSKNLLLPLLLSEVRADGSQVKKVHAKDPVVDQFMQDAEAKFARHDLDGALEGYRRALELDPRCYQAALYSGDVYFSNKDFAAALPWYERAIAIDPAKETAHRYRADALTRLNRSDEAGEGYVAAFVAAPFAPLPTSALNNWMTRRKLTLKRPDASFLAGELTFPEGKPQLLLDPKHSGALTVGYLLGRAAYVTEKKIPAGNYHPSLAEEVAGVRTMLKMARELKAKTPPDPDLAAHAKTLEALGRVERDGLLEAFILLDHPSKEIIAEYAAYRAKHRDRLERYVRTIWLGLP